MHFIIVISTFKRIKGYNVCVWSLHPLFLICYKFISFSFLFMALPLACTMSFLENRDCVFVFSEALALILGRNTSTLPTYTISYGFQDSANLTGYFAFIFQLI